MSEYIEREVAIAVIEEKQKELCPVGMYSRHAVYGSDREKFDAWQEIIDALEAIPAADVRPVVRAHWTDRRTIEHDGEWYCSNCGNEVTICMCGKDKTRDYPFCPSCGADMREES